MERHLEIFLMNFEHTVYTNSLHANPNPCAHLIVIGSYIGKKQLSEVHVALIEQLDSTTEEVIVLVYLIVPL